MDSSSDKLKLWFYVVGAVVFSVMFAHDLSSAIAGNSSLSSTYIPLFLVVNYVFLVFRWIALNRKKKKLEPDEKTLAKIEHSNDLVNTVFFNATGVLLLAGILTNCLVKGRSAWFTVAVAILIICTICLLFINIKSLKQFNDRNHEKSA